MTVNERKVYNRVVIKQGLDSVVLPIRLIDDVIEALGLVRTDWRKV